MKKILVTGGTGFIGCELVSALKKQGCYVRVLARSVKPFVTGVDDFFQGDLARPDSLQGVAQDCDTVFHLGGYAHAHSKPYAAEIERHRIINFAGTRAILQQAQESKVERFLYVSSVKAAGENSRQCIDEDNQCVPIDAYGKIKRQCEQEVLAAAERTGMHACVIRPALVYGKDVQGNLATMAHWVEKGFFPSLCDTHNIRSMVEVRDVVAAMLAGAQKNQANGKTYIITDGEAYSTRRIYQAMRIAAGKSVPVWCVPGMLLRALGVLGDGLEYFLRRPLSLNSVIVARLLDSACYRSGYAHDDLDFTPRYRFEDVCAEIVSAGKNSAASHPVEDKGD